MSAPLSQDAVHLLAADGISPTHVALCGALVPASRLPPSSCPPDCACALYCPQCVQVITCWHAEADHG